MKYHALFVIFEKKQQNLKLSSAANHRWRLTVSSYSYINHKRFTGNVSIFITEFEYPTYFTCYMFANTFVHVHG